MSGESSLYEAGWRQGTLLDTRLKMYATVAGDTGALEPTEIEHPKWIIVSQDCDLEAASINDTAPTIELRPVFTDRALSVWGIKSQKLRLDRDGRFLDSSKPHLHVSPAALTLLREAPRSVLDDARVRALKTWLGFRYRRPAVPTDLVPLAQAIAAAATKHKRAEVVAHVHEVLFQVDETQNPPRYSLYAIIETDVVPDDVRVWLSQIAVEVPRTLGIADVLEAHTKGQTSLTLVETSWTAQLSDITWRSAAEPTGAGAGA